MCRARLASLTVADLFQHSSVASLAELVASRSAEPQTAVTLTWSASGQTIGPASRAQQRVFLDSQIRFEQQGSQRVGHLQHSRCSFDLNGELDCEKLQLLSDRACGAARSRCAQRWRWTAKASAACFSACCLPACASVAANLWLRSELKAAWPSSLQQPFDLSSGENLALLPVRRSNDRAQPALRVLGSVHPSRLLRWLCPSQLLSASFQHCFAASTRPAAAAVPGLRSARSSWLASDEVKAGWSTGSARWTAPSLW